MLCDDVCLKNKKRLWYRSDITNSLCAVMCVMLYVDVSVCCVMTDEELVCSVFVVCVFVCVCCVQGFICVFVLFGGGGYVCVWLLSIPYLDKVGLQ